MAQGRPDVLAKLTTREELFELATQFLAALPPAGTPAAQAVDQAAEIAVIYLDLNRSEAASLKRTWTQLVQKFAEPGERVLGVLAKPRRTSTGDYGKGFETVAVAFDGGFGVKEGGNQYRLPTRDAQPYWTFEHSGYHEQRIVRGAIRTGAGYFSSPIFGGAYDGVGMSLVLQLLVADQKEAAAKTPRTRSTRRNPAARNKPAPRLIRTANDAELVAAEWMTFWGCANARATPIGADAGIDVNSDDAVAQVKAEAKPVGRPAIQQHHGVATGLGKTGLFFALAGYTPAAQTWAAQHGIVLFRFDLQGTPEPASALAHAWVAERSR